MREKRAETDRKYVETDGGQNLMLPRSRTCRWLVAAPRPLLMHYSGETVTHQCAVTQIVTMAMMESEVEGSPGIPPDVLPHVMPACSLYCFMYCPTPVVDEALPHVLRQV